MASSRNLDTLAESIEAQQLASPAPRVSLLRKCIKGFGVAMIAAGMISVIIGSVMVSLDKDYAADYTASGVWNGIFFTATGFCALYALKRTNDDSIVATIVTSLFSILLAVGIISEMKTSLTAENFNEIPDGFKAAEILLMVIGIAEIVLSGCCMVAASVHLHLCRRGDYTTEPVTGNSLLLRLKLTTSYRDGIGAETTDLTTDPSPFSTMQEVVTLQWIGLWKIAVGLACITVGSILLRQKVPEDISCGIWCGVAFTLTGILATIASWTHIERVVCATLLMSILSLLLVQIMVFNGLLFTLTDRVCNKNPYCIPYVQGSKIATQYGILVVLGIAEMIMSFWCFALCWKAVCCCCCTQKVVRQSSPADRARQNITKRSLSSVRSQTIATRSVESSRNDRPAIIGTDTTSS